MTHEKKQQAMLVQVADGLTVSTFKHPNHDFLMPSKDVAEGYGVSASTLRTCMSRYPNDFTEGIHFVRAVSVVTPLKNVQPHAVLWTKRGVISLGFHIQGKKALMFRQWAENVILEKLGKTPKTVVLPIPQKRNHNRITPIRMVGILTDIAKIEDSKLRLSLIEKLGV